MHKSKGNANSCFGRLKAVGAGLILVTVGVLRMVGFVQVVTHWTGQPKFSWSLVAAGIVCILSALVPLCVHRQGGAANSTFRACFPKSSMLD